MPVRLLPSLNEYNTHFWTGGEKGVFYIQRCGDCGYYVHPPAPVCRKCKSLSNLAPTEVSGRATIITFTINQHPWSEGQEPYALALVALEEQEDLRLTTNIVNCAFDEIKIGMPVEVVFEQVHDVWVPLFQPVGAPQGKAASEEHR